VNRSPILCTLCLLFASAALLSACGDDAGDPGPSIDGIYKVDSHTLNETSCDAPGPAATQPYAFLLVGQQTISFGGAGGAFMQADNCADLAACRERKSQNTSGNINLGGFIFDKGNNTAGWTGSVTSFSQGGATSNCEGSVKELSLTPITATAEASSNAPTRLRLEIREWPVTLPPGPEDPDQIGPNCDDTNIVAEAKKNPCGSLEVIEATFAE
jgi:hypothetical protein